jgi:hypothetical protein
MPFAFPFESINSNYFIYFSSCLAINSGTMIFFQVIYYIYQILFLKIKIDLVS